MVSFLDLQLPWYAWQIWLEIPPLHEDKHCPRQYVAKHIEMDQLGQKFQIDFLLFLKWLFFQLNFGAHIFETVHCVLKICIIGQSCCQWSFLWHVTHSAFSTQVELQSESFKNDQSCCKNYVHKNCEIFCDISDIFWSLDKKKVSQH